MIVRDWNCQCSACGYGGTSAEWMWGRDTEPITQTSERCPGCDARFIARKLADDARRPAPNYYGDDIASLGASSRE
jgi:hypothetical protein